MTKVEHTKTHYADIKGKKPFDESGNVLITDAELVLVPCQIGINGLEVVVKDKHYHPILISRTEKIESGDWAYAKLTGTIFQVKEVDTSTGREYLTASGILCPSENAFKILALPEHFSPQQLQDIVDGKLKGKLLVECNKGGCLNYTENKTCKTPCDTPFCYYPSIKLNPHITIYPVEEKMYTREEVKQYAWYAVQHSSKLESKGQKVIHRKDIDAYLDLEMV